MGTKAVIQMSVVKRNGDARTRKVWFKLRIQFDGVPSVTGKRLCNFLHSMKVVDGISNIQPDHPIANGAPCLFAQIVAEFKQPDPVAMSGFLAGMNAVLGPEHPDFQKMKEKMKFSDNAGRVYLYPAEGQNMGEEFTYHVDVAEDGEGSPDGESGIQLEILGRDEVVLFSGNAEDGLHFCESEDAE